MSILGNRNNMSTPFFHEFKKQASFFLKEKIKTARLALTDVTPAELLTEEATNGNPWSPDTQTMRLISRAAFEVDDYWRIVEILHKRLARFDRKNWRVSYQALILLEHLLTHGPESAAEEFQTDKEVIQGMESFQYIDERGFNWGLTVRKKSDRILKLLEKGPLLKEERDRARKLTRGIEGFGSFCQRSSSENGSFGESSFRTYQRSSSDYNTREDEQFSSPKEAGSAGEGIKRTQPTQEVCDVVVPAKPMENPTSWDSSDEGQMVRQFDTQTSLKENVAPTKELHEWDCKRESRPLLGGEKDELKIGYSIEEDHPFIESEHQSAASLLSAKNKMLDGC